MKERAYYQSAVVFGLGVIAMAVLLFAIIHDIGADRQQPMPAAQQEEDPLFADMRQHPDFKSWIAKWREVDPYVSVAEFTRIQSGAIRTVTTPDLAIVPEPEQLASPLAERYVWSPDRAKFIDYLANYGEPDSSLQAYGRDGRGRIETLAYCGTACRFDRVFWLDADRAVVLGIEQAQKGDGTPLCLPSAGDAVKCYQRLNATAYDFARGTQTTYRSERHLFASQPFGRESAERWAAGLAPEARAAVGLDLGGDVESISGTISEIAVEARILTLVGGRVPRIVTVAEKAPIRDERGKLVPFSALHSGFTVEAQAVSRPDGSVVAAALRIVRAPNVIVDAPADGGAVPAKFAVKGIARVFEGNVRVRVMNGRTGKTIVDGFTTAAAPGVGLFGPFTYAVALPVGSVKRGDDLSLEVFGTSAEDGSETDKAIILLRYQP